MTKRLAIHGVDLSNNNEGPFNLDAAKTAGVRFMFHKATEGTSFQDAFYAARRRAAKAAGIQFGAYHFARPTRSSGVAQARYFLAYAKPAKGDLRPVLDFEDPAVEGWSSAKRTAWVKSFVGEVVRQLGVPPFIYCRSGFDLDEHFDCPLWVPRYSNSNSAPTIPHPWTTHTLWQFSDGAYGLPNSVPGIGHCDINTVNGDPAKLLPVFTLGAKPKAAKPKPATPKHHPEKTPAPAPEPVPVVAPHPTPIVDEVVAVAEKGVAANKGQQRKRFVRLRAYIKRTFGK